MTHVTIFESSKNNTRNIYMNCFYLFWFLFQRHKFAGISVCKGTKVLLVGKYQFCTCPRMSTTQYLLKMCG